MTMFHREIGLWWICAVVLVCLTLRVVRVDGKSCAAPNDIQNGRYNMSEGTDIGARIFIICNEGYQLVSRFTFRTCTETGWDNRDPVCEAVTCLPPPEIANGKHDWLSDAFLKYQETVTFTCDLGYTLIGSAMLRCSHNGSLTPHLPSCQVVNCPEPNIPNGHRVEGRPPYGYLSQVTYECNPGYVMSGKGKLICDVTGWNAPFPVCSMVINTPATPSATTKTVVTPRPSVYGSTEKGAFTTTTTLAPEGKQANVTPHTLGVLIALLIPAVLELFL